MEGSLQEPRRGSKEEGSLSSQSQLTGKLKQSNTVDALRMPQARGTLLESILEAQSKVQLRKEQGLRQTSEDIRLNLDDRFQRQARRQQENCQQ